MDDAAFSPACSFAFRVDMPATGGFKKNRTAGPESAVVCYFSFVLRPRFYYRNCTSRVAAGKAKLFGSRAVPKALKKTRKIYIFRLSGGGGFPAKIF